MPTATEPAPEKVETVETPTGITGTIKAETDAALKEVQGGGFDDPAFDAALQAAMDKDAGKTPEPPPPQQTTPDTKVTTEATAKAAELAAKQEELRKLQEAAGDIPDVLLGVKPPETKTTDEAAAVERQKFIDEQTKGMTPKAAERFKKIENRAWEAEQKARKIEQEQQQAAAELKKQIAELSAKAAAPKDDDTEKLRKELERLQEVVTKNDLLNHPAFKDTYDAPIANEMEEMKKLVAAENAEELSQIAMLPDSKKRKERIKELVDGLDDLDRIKVLTSIAKVDELNTKKSKELNNWKENRVHLEAKEIEKRQVEQAAMANQQKVAWNNAMAVITSPDKGLEVFRKLDGNDAWNARVDARIAQVQQQLSGDVPSERIMEMAARSVAAEEYRKMFLAQRILVNKLSEELASLKQAQPDAGDDGGGGGPVEDNRSFVDAAVEGAVRAGALKQ